jgi:hypothetical protein
MSTTNNNTGRTTLQDTSRTILITLITTIITQSITYYIWTRQFNINKSQQLYEHKVASFENFVKDGIRMIYLAGYIDRVKLEQRKLDYSMRVHLKGVLQRDSSSSNYKQRLQIQDSIRKLYPLIYEKHLLGLDFQSEYYSSSNTALTFYRLSTSIQILKLEKLFGQSYLDSMLDEQTKKFKWKRFES